MPHLGQYTIMAILCGCMILLVPVAMSSAILRTPSPKLPPWPCLDLATNFAAMSLGVAACGKIGIGMCQRKAIGFAQPNSEFCRTPKPLSSWSLLIARDSAETVLLVVLSMAACCTLLSSMYV